MPITVYTTYNDVRAVLGVSSKDLSDDTLALNWYSDALDDELDGVHANLATFFSDASQAQPPSDKQVRLMRSVRTFAATVVAKAATTGLPMFAPQQVGDGKAMMARFSDPVRDIVKSVEKAYQAAKDKLVLDVAALEEVSSTGVARVWFSVVSPVDDPVTG